jgi:hypothetical protein
MTENKTKSIQFILEFRNLSDLNTIINVCLMIGQALGRLPYNFTVSWRILEEQPEEEAAEKEETAENSQDGEETETEEGGQLSIPEQNHFDGVFGRIPEIW